MDIEIGSERFLEFLEFLEIWENLGFFNFFLKKMIFF
jgi:hypothetical protein